MIGAASERETAASHLAAQIANYVSHSPPAAQGYLLLSLYIYLSLPLSIPLSTPLFLPLFYPQSRLQLLEL